MKTKTINHIVNIIGWLVVCLLYISDTLQPSPEEKVYTGGEAILPTLEVMHIQPGLANVLGERKALIVQKLHEWVLVNQKKGTHKHDGATWTYGSHADWHKRHFSWFSASYLGKLLKQLVDDGFLFATDEAPFCHKGQFAYRVNYLKISESVDWQKLQYPPAKIAQPPRTNCTTPAQKLQDNNIETQEGQNKSFKQSDTTTTNTRPPEAQPPTLADDVDVVEEKSDSGVFAGLGETVRDSQVDFVPEPIQEHVGTPPGSAPPPSEHDELVAQMVRVAGFFPDAARRLIDDHTAIRCQAIANYIVAEKPKMETPAGWFVSELQNNWRAIPDDYGHQSAENPYKSGKWSDIINQGVRDGI